MSSPTAEDWSLPGEYGELFQKVQEGLARFRNSQEEKEEEKEEGRMRLRNKIRGKHFDVFMSDEISASVNSPETRASNIRPRVKAYAEEQFYSGNVELESLEDDSDVEAILSDMVADLLHLADDLNVRPIDVLRLGAFHHSEESDNDLVNLTREAYRGLDRLSSQNQD